MGGISRLRRVWAPNTIAWSRRLAWDMGCEVAGLAWPVGDTGVLAKGQRHFTNNRTAVIIGVIRIN